ncbi:MAG: hypothetical protein V3R41_06415 [Gammaproteobacteria bacterium]
MALSSKLKEIWGDDSEENMEYAKRAIQAFGDDGAINKLESIFSDVEVTLVMARIGRQMESSVQKDQHKSLVKELDELTGRDDYWSNEKTQERVRAINVELYGDFSSSLPNRNN